ncbi:MAG: heavy metal translocating P-type ATPase [Flavobacteriaceae bacterium]|nr:heavy metal translocating P-type ATPase [Flavobacteriaceae bacterium]
MTSCYHCGDSCENQLIRIEEKAFCCNGCKTVYEILSGNDLSYYYDLEKNPGISPELKEGKFDYLDNAEIASKLLEFDDGDTRVVSFLIPSMHCSSCIWVLENLSKLNEAIKTSQVNFPEKTIRITFSSESLSLKNLVTILSTIGYEPNISLNDYSKKTKKMDRSLIYKLGVAGFAFGNVMFLSFPEYFEVGEFWLERFKHLFRWLMFAFALPVVFYSGSGYFISAYKGLKSKILNIDVPIALGIATLFIRSTIDIVFDWGSGFFDSLTGLVFFLLLGKFFQQKTYAYLSFERDYKSYFPMAVTKLTRNGIYKAPSEEQIQIYKIKKGDQLLIRNEEIIPADCILLKGEALIDYSFVTGEAHPLMKESGDKIYAGGRQKTGSIEVEVVKSVEQSYLTQLWSNEVFRKDRKGKFQNLTNSISKHFTIAVLSIAFITTAFWIYYDPSKAFNVFTAVLIVACPCAIALAAPFTLGNLLRIFGRHKFYLKEASTIEQLAAIDTVIFDKTGTLTTHRKNTITYQGIALTKEEETLLNSTLRASNHPLSRALYQLLKSEKILTLDEFEESVGKGIYASRNGQDMKVGSYTYVSNTGDAAINERATNQTEVHIRSNDEYKGYYLFQNSYRREIDNIFEELAPQHDLVILSGDNEGEKEYLHDRLPTKVQLCFNRKPQDKLEYVKELQKQGRKVLMVGDGLNDAGALAQSDVGVVISEDINVFSPACDGIIDASRFKDLTKFMSLSKRGITIIKWSFLLSLLYNLVGLGFAVTGHLEPVVAAILMPLSSISIVVFTTVMTQWIGKKLHAKN